MKSYFIHELTFSELQTHRIYSRQYYTLLLITQGRYVVRGSEGNYPCSLESFVLAEPDTHISVERLVSKKTSSTNATSAKSLSCASSVLVFQFDHELLKEVSTEVTNLKQGFHTVPFQYTVIDPPTSLFVFIHNLLIRLKSLPDQPLEYGQDIFEHSLVSMLLVLLLRACISQDKKHISRYKKEHLIVDDIFSYIKAHIAEEITLEHLEQAFFVSRFHIAREFKKQTGDTVHNYIIKVKMERCRQYIREGRPITEVCQLGGFHDYHNFFRNFKKLYGMTPKEYYKNTICEIPSHVK